MYIYTHSRVFNEIIKPNGFIRLENRGERAHAEAPGNRGPGQKDPRKTHRQRDVELYFFFFYWLRRMANQQPEGTRCDSFGCENTQIYYINV